MLHAVYLFWLSVQTIQQIWPLASTHKKNPPFLASETVDDHEKIASMVNASG